MKISFINSNIVDVIVLLIDISLYDLCAFYCTMEINENQLYQFQSFIEKAIEYKHNKVLLLNLL